MRNATTCLIFGLACLSMTACVGGATRQSSSASATPQRCSDLSKPSRGLGNVHCVDADLIDETHYCLRDNANRPERIRHWTNENALTTSGINGHARFEYVCPAKAPAFDAANPCKPTFDIAEKGQTFQVKHLWFGEPKFRIADGPWLPLTFDDAGYFAIAKGDTYDYFIMLRDQLAPPPGPHLNRIERFLIVEAYDRRYMSEECKKERPDYRDETTNKLTNIHEWDGVGSECESAEKKMCPREHGTGGGGHDYP